MSAQFHTVDQVAAILSLQPRTIRGFIRDGKLKATRIGKQYRILASDLDELAGMGSQSVASGSDERKVSSTIDVELKGLRDADRIFGMISGLSAAQDGRNPKSRIDTLLYEDEARLKIILQGDMYFVSHVTNAIASVLAE